jgi:hypothetical protein
MVKHKFFLLRKTQRISCESGNGLTTLDSISRKIGESCSVVIDLETNFSWS